MCSFSPSLGNIELYNAAREGGTAFASASARRDRTPTPASSSEIDLSWTAATGSGGLTYQVEYKDDLIDFWAPAAGFIPGTGSLVTWIDDGTATGAAPTADIHRFYRIRAILP